MSWFLGRARLPPETTTDNHGSAGASPSQRTPTRPRQRHSTRWPQSPARSAAPDRTIFIAAPRPVAATLPVRAVHQDLERLLVVAVHGHPQRQQQRLERDRRVPRPLVAGPAGGRRRCPGGPAGRSSAPSSASRVRKPSFKPDGVPLGAEPAQVLRAERFELRPGPTAQSRSSRSPGRLLEPHTSTSSKKCRTSPDTGYQFVCVTTCGSVTRLPWASVSVYCSVVGVVLAALAVVEGVRHRVVGPVRQVHAGELAEAWRSSSARSGRTRGCRARS